MLDIFLLFSYHIQMFQMVFAYLRGGLFHSVHESVSILCFRFWKCGLFYMIIKQNFCHRESSGPQYVVFCVNIQVILVLNKLIIQSSRKPVGKSPCMLDLGTIKS